MKTLKGRMQRKGRANDPLLRRKMELVKIHKKPHLCKERLPRTEGAG